nr:hypothetical protein [Desulfoprunum benzoelyticum]
MDDDALPITDDQQRRVVEMEGVVGELLEGAVEIPAGLLVLPAETAALPDIGPTVAAAGLLRPAFKAVVLGVTRLLDPKEIAEVIEMGLRPGPLGEGVVLPGGDEFVGGHETDRG